MLLDSCYVVLLWFQSMNIVIEKVKHYFLRESVQKRWTNCLRLHLLEFWILSGFLHNTITVHWCCWNIKRRDGNRAVISLNLPLNLLFGACNCKHIISTTTCDTIMRAYYTHKWTTEKVRVSTKKKLTLWIHKKERNNRATVVVLVLIHTCVSTQIVCRSNITHGHCTRFDFVFIHQ